MDLDYELALEFAEQSRDDAEVDRLMDAGLWDHENVRPFDAE